MYCWYCGKSLPGAAAFCYRCGQAQDEGAEFDPAAAPLAPHGWPWSHARPDDPSESAIVPVAEGPVGVAPLSVVVELAASLDAGGVQAEDDAVPEAPAARRPPNPVAGVLGIACGVLVVAGSVGPWVTARVLWHDPISIRGSEGDGRVTLCCGLAAVVCLAALLASPRRAGLGVAAAGAFFLATLIGIADWSNVSAHLDELGRLGPGARLVAEIGWGLPAVTLGGLAGSVLAAIQTVQARRVRH